MSLYVYEDLPEVLTLEVEKQFWNSSIHVNEDCLTEWAFLQLFRTSPCRTQSIREANLFVVPYMHISDCMTSAQLHGGYGPGCSSVSDEKIKLLFDHLRKQESFSLHPERHLFLTMYDEYMMNKRMNQVHMKLVSTPARKSHQCLGTITCTIR
eukprot:CAMPEP_0181058210 /NCGR_PEP_ID=MMETSP1070-20121207/20684_1 /TAXON_ID=265543 /ORGANISM="Minutocellus polymorphus, Strain NH13" /LENGTH=152 /DNA_ID=CAMNT_0023137719 /DNA_START=421 /DNA_END=879 /DNA_ORIENTATION=+